MGSAGRGEDWPCPPRGSPPSGTLSVDPENKARRSTQVGERDPRDRPLPEAVRLPPANRGPALGYFRCSSAPPPTPKRVALNSLLAGALPLRLRPQKSRMPVRFAGLFASGFACHLHEWSTLPHPFRASLFLNSPPPQDPGGAQPRPTKGLGGDFAFGLLPLSRLRESGSRLEQPGSASGSIQCVQGCRSPPPGKCAFGSVPKSRKGSAPGPGVSGGAGPHRRTGESRLAAIRRPERRRETGRGFERA